MLITLYTMALVLPSLAAGRLTTESAVQTATDTRSEPASEEDSGTDSDTQGEGKGTIVIDAGHGGF